jgi:hypothetical protein
MVLLIQGIIIIDLITVLEMEYQEKYVKLNTKMEITIKEE